VINRVAIAFGSTFKQSSSLPSSLDLDNTQSTLVSIHHATRKSSLTSFLRRGINLGDDAKPNEFHHTGAFYTSNVVANSVAHVLTYHHHPLLAAVDPVMVLSFVVDPRVLLGTIPNENGYLFRVKLLSVPSGPLEAGYHVAFQAYRAVS
jgi:hypothetical protein